MKARVALVVVAALLLGAAGGYAVAASQGGDPRRETDPAVVEVGPVPASPSLPVEVILPDPDDETLAPGIALDLQKLTVVDAAGRPRYVLRLPAPVGWVREFDGVAKWTYTVAGNSDNSFGLRVQVVADQGESVATALRSRTSALESSQAQGNMSDLEIVPDSTGDGFEASFVASGFRRITVEQFFGGDDPTEAFATVAAFGRMQDRDGLVDLIALISRDLRTEEPQ